MVCPGGKKIYSLQIHGFGSKLMLDVRFEDDLAPIDDAVATLERNLGITLLEDAVDEDTPANGLSQKPKFFTFEDLLDPLIKDKAYKFYKRGDHREAVLNSVIALFDEIRSKTGIDLDGDKLVERAFAPKDPYLVFSELDTESGRKDQQGFLQLFQGAYQAIRNPKAHTLDHDLIPESAAQYLVFASLLARRLRDSKVIKKDG